MAPRKSRGYCVVEFRKDMLARESEIRRVVDLGPGQTGRAGVSDLRALVGQLLHSDIEEFIDLAGRHEPVERPEEVALDSERKGRDADIGSAELQTGNLLAHFYDAAITDDDLHRFIAPIGIDDHGN